MLSCMAWLAEERLRSCWCGHSSRTSTERRFMMLLAGLALWPCLYRLCFSEAVFPPTGPAGPIQPAHCARTDGGLSALRQATAPPWRSSGLPVDVFAALEEHSRKVQAAVQRFRDTQVSSPLRRSARWLDRPCSRWAIRRSSASGHWTASLAGGCRHAYRAGCLAGYLPAQRASSNRTGAGPSSLSLLASSRTTCRRTLLGSG